MEDALLVGIGFGVGLFGTLIGAGGGFILVPILLLMFPKDDPSVLTAISLAVVFFNASSGSVAYGLMGRIDYKSALWFCIATIPGAVLGALTSQIMPRKVFSMVFGILLVAACIYLFAFPDRKKSEHPHGKPGRTERLFADKSGIEHKYTFDMRLGLVISAFVGYISSVLGIGGGIVHVPALSQLLNFPVHVATATSHLILAVTALVGTVTHIIMGDFHGDWKRAILIGLGAVVGAQFGARLSNKIHGPGIIRALAIALGLVGIRVFFLGFK